MQSPSKVMVCLVAASVMAGVTDCSLSKPCYHNTQQGASIYDFLHPDITATRNISLSDFKGQVVLIVNVATYWGYSRQYPDLNALQQRFSNFSIIAFPCNQFGLQEPGGDGSEISNAVKYVRPGGGFEPNFLMMEKTEVNGENELPLFTFLKSSCPATREHFAKRDKLYYDPLKVRDIRWNWEKFLINKSGKPFMRYDASIKPQDIASDVLFLLEQDL